MYENNLVTVIAIKLMYGLINEERVWILDTISVLYCMHTHCNKYVLIYIVCVC